MPSHLVLGWSADLVLTPGGWREFRDLPGKPMVKPRKTYGKTLGNLWIPTENLW